MEKVGKGVASPATTGRRPLGCLWGRQRVLISQRVLQDFGSALLQQTLCCFSSQCFCCFDWAFAFAIRASEREPFRCSQ